MKNGRGSTFESQLTEEMLDRAWCLKEKGFSDRIIAAKIGCSRKSYDLFKWRFEKWFAKKRRTRIKGSPGGPRRPSRLDEMRRASIELAKLGESLHAISTRLGIPHSTFKNWMKIDEVFDHEIRTAKDKADTDVIRSLYRKANGFTVRQTYNTKCKDGHGNVITNTTQTTTRRLAPNMGAIKMWLINRRGWVSEAEGSRINDDENNVEYDVREGLYSEEKESKNVE